MDSDGGLLRKGSSYTVQLTDLLKAALVKTCECVLVEGGPGMGKSTLAYGRCVTAGEEESSLNSTRQCCFSH